MSLRHKRMHCWVVSIIGIALALVASFSFSAERNYAGISVQLWSVRGDVSRDIKGTLKKLADMGFDGVELAGEFGEFAEDPEGLKQYLHSLGLTISGAHVGFDQFSCDRFEKNAKFYQALGVDKVIIPSDHRAWSADGIDDLVQDLEQLYERLKPYGIEVGYHNHHLEFNAFKGTTFWDYLAQNTSDDIILQLDLGWAVFAEQDPETYVKRYQNRIPTSHFKANATIYSDVAPMLEEAGVETRREAMIIIRQHKQSVADKVGGPKPLIGRDVVPWKRIIDQFGKSKEPVWFVVEQEIYPNGTEPLAAVKQSLTGLKHFLKQ